MLTEETKKYFRRFQQEELNDAAVYQRISRMVKSEQEKEKLTAIARDEIRHARVFAKHTGLTLRPNRFMVFCFTLLARLLGYTFVIKVMEKRENTTILKYQVDRWQQADLKSILEDELLHEQELIAMLDEERLHYVSDIVLGMNDALVELTGAMAGYTLAMRNTQVIAMAGLITGISATLSMASSGYLASKEDGSKNAGKSALYTGTSYLITVVLLVLPYLLLPATAYMPALAITLVTALAIIAGFNYYTKVTKERPFKKSFFTMAAISLGVALISFGVGILVKNVLGIDL